MSTFQIKTHHPLQSELLMAKQACKQLQGFKGQSGIPGLPYINKPLQNLKRQEITTWLATTAGLPGGSWIPGSGTGNPDTLPGVSTISV